MLISPCAAISSGREPLRKISRLGVPFFKIVSVSDLALAFSSDPSKESEARSFGAHHFVNSKQDNFSPQYDFIISTVNADLNWGTYINALRSNGKLVFVGIPSKSLEVPVGQLLSSRRSISASPIGSRAVIEDMLEFSARHQIKALTQTCSFKDVNSAIEKVRSSKARYRLVLTH